MGLDTSHDCWHGSYSSFNRFRESLAEQIGTKLNEYEGFGGQKKFDTLKHDIRPLLDHSDCDGTLSVQEAKQVANGLTSILENFNENLNYDIYSFKQRIIRFRDGCLDAVRLNEPIDFH